MNQSLLTIGSARSSLEGVDMMDDTENDTMLTVDSMATTQSKATKSRRGTVASKKGGARKKKAAAIEDTDMLDAPEPAVEEEEKPKRGRRQVSRQVSAQVDVLDESQIVKPKKQTRGRKPKVTESQIEAQPEVQLEEPVNEASMDTVIYNDPEEAPRASRGTKRNSDGQPKAATKSKGKAKTQVQDSSIVILDEAPIDFEQKATKAQKAKRGKKATASTAKKNPSPEVYEDPEPEQEAAPEPEPEPKPKKTKMMAAKRKPLGELEPEVVQRESERVMRLSGVDIDNNAKAMSVEPSDASSAVDVSTPNQPGTPIVSDGSSNEPPTPTPARVVFKKLARASLDAQEERRQSNLKSSMIPPKTTARTSDLEKRAETPKKAGEASPQSSDAENKPPSARPEAVRKGLQLNPVSPLRPTTISYGAMTPKRAASPSKFVVSRLQTTVPWSPADVEAVFQAGSPTKFLIDDKENFPGGASAAKDVLRSPERMPLGKAVTAARARMTSPEKRMTVEEWIRHRAEKASERLKQECETMVTAFERQGERAMRVLESVEAE
jgi:hypothetical protein